MSEEVRAALAAKFPDQPPIWTAAFELAVIQLEKVEKRKEDRKKVKPQTDDDFAFDAFFPEMRRVPKPEPVEDETEEELLAKAESNLQLASVEYWNVNPVLPTLPSAPFISRPSRQAKSSATRSMPSSTPGLRICI